MLLTMKMLLTTPLLLDPKEMKKEGLPFERRPYGGPRPPYCGDPVVASAMKRGEMGTAHVEHMNGILGLGVEMGSYVRDQAAETGEVRLMMMKLLFIEEVVGITEKNMNAENLTAGEVVVDGEKRPTYKDCCVEGAEEGNSQKNHRPRLLRRNSPV